VTEAVSILAVRIGVFYIAKVATDACKV